MGVAKLRLTFELLAQQLPLLAELRLQLLERRLGLIELQLQGLFEQRDLSRNRSTRHTVCYTHRTTSEL